MSMQWGGWRTAGMATHDVHAIRRMDMYGMGSLTAEQGLSALWGAVQSAQRTSGSSCTVTKVVAASPFAWDVFREHVPDATSAMYSELCVDVSSCDTARSTRQSTDLTHRGAKSAPAASCQQIKAQVLSAVESVMGSAVGEHDPLMDAGLDSLGAVEVKSSIERSTGVQLPATVVFDYPSVGAIAAYLSSIAGPSPGEADDASPGTVSLGGNAGSDEVMPCVLQWSQHSANAAGGIEPGGQR